LPGIPVTVPRILSFTALLTVEVSHKPSRVASPSSRWNTQRNRAPSAVGLTLSPSPTLISGLKWGFILPLMPVVVHTRYE